MKPLFKTNKLFTRSLPLKGFYYFLIAAFFLGCNQQKASGENKITREQVTTDVKSSPHDSGIHTPNSITVVNWNIEWLGSSSNGPKNKERQLQNAIKVLKYLHADLYCLCEIVDPEALIRLTDALGNNFGYALSPYGSGAKSIRDAGYQSAQKLAFIYNTDLFRQVKTSAFLASDPRAGYYFASGRYPYDLEATIQTAEVRQTVNFMIIHGKSGSDLSSYDRRLQAAVALKTALDQQKKSDAVMLLGDFNDHIKGSITNGKPSPYAAFVKDPAYHVLTLELADQKSTLDYPGVIDQQIASKSLNRYYMSGSTRIRTDILAVVPDFKKGATSDHYPVSSVFIFDKARQNAPPLSAIKANSGVNTNVSTVSTTTRTSSVNDAANDNPSVGIPQKIQQRIFSASVNTDNILIRCAVKSQHIQFILYNKRQHKVLSVHRKYILKGDSFQLRTPKLYKGDYTLVIFSDHGKQVIAFSVN